MELSKFSDRIAYRLLNKKIDFILDYFSSSKELIQDSDDDNWTLKFGKYNDSIEEFVDRFHSCFAEKHAKKMLRQLKGLALKEESKKVDVLEDCISLGHYDSDTNRITIGVFDNPQIQKNQKSTLFHELFHMSSTKKTNNGSITGFSIPGIIGEVLDEGYTELLVERITPYDSYENAKERAKFLVRGIENVVGKEKMEDFYFDADLYSLIKKLMKVVPKKDILKVLFAMDHLSLSLFFNSSQFRALVIEIARWNSIKLDKDYYEGRISREEFENQYAIKVCEYRKYRTWGEDAKVIDNDGFFFIQDERKTSDIYERDIPETEKKL